MRTTVRGGRMTAANGAQQRWGLGTAAGVLGLSVLALSFGPRAARRDSEEPSRAAARAITARLSPGFVSASRTALENYDRAADCLLNHRDGEAIAHLQSARRSPLFVSAADGNAPVHISTPSLLVRLGRALCDRAVAESAAGRSEAALGWIQRTRAIADHVMETPVPTLDAFLAAHSVDARAGLAEARILENAGRRDEAVRAAARERTLTRIYRRDMLPQIKAASQRRQVVEQEVGSAQMYQIAAVEDGQLAVTLLEQYTRERSRARVVLNGAVGRDNI